MDGRLEFTTSRQLHDTASAVIPGGVNSNVRFGEQPHPLFFSSGDGPYIYDEDGNQIIDYVMGQGPLLLGHRPPDVVSAVMEQLEKGILYGAQHRTEVEVAELVVEMVPSAEVVRFNMTGTEAVQAALRVARAATGRDKIVKFSGHYHGWGDNVLFNVAGPSQPVGGGPGLELEPESAGLARHAGAPLLVVPWNDVDALTSIVAPVADDVAAIIMEPVMANSGVIEPADGYLTAVRGLCDRYGIVLIFDEVITGFRLRPGGAQERYGVTPDLTTMGKAMASGFPIGCLAGKAELMKGIASGEVMHAGTFNATPISMAAARAVLGYLRAEADAWYGGLEERGRRLMEGMTGIVETRGGGLLVQGLPAIFNIMVTDRDSVSNHEDVLETDRKARAALQRALIAAGVRISGHGNLFLSGAHGDGVVDNTLERFEHALAELDSTT